MSYPNNHTDKITEGDDKSMTIAFVATIELDDSYAKKRLLPNGKSPDDRFPAHLQSGGTYYFIPKGKTEGDWVSYKMLIDDVDSFFKDELQDVLQHHTSFKIHLESKKAREGSILIEFVVKIATDPDTLNYIELACPFLGHGPLKDKCEFLKLGYKNLMSFVFSDGLREILERETGKFLSDMRDELLNVKVKVEQIPFSSLKEFNEMLEEQQEKIQTLLDNSDKLYRKLTKQFNFFLVLQGILFFLIFVFSILSIKVLAM